MAENMHKELSCGNQPARHSPQEQLVIPHVFKHFDGNDAVEPLLGGEIAHVRSYYPEIVEAAISHKGFDKLTWARRIGHCRDLAPGIMLGDPK